MPREALWHADFSTVRDSFARWTLFGHFPLDREIYTIAGAPAVDSFVRYERLHDDLAGICKRLSVPWQPQRLGRYKNEYRKRPEHFLEYYTPGAAARVAEAFAWEMDYFGYSASTKTPSL
jgi:hypothetical protein